MSDVVRDVSKVLLPASMVIALAVLVKGYSAVGDGFSAGVIAALGVIVQYVGIGRSEARQQLRVDLALPGAVFGLLVLLGVVFLPSLLGRPVVTHYPRPLSPVTYIGSLELHTAMVFDTAVFLVVLCSVVLLLDHVIEPRGETS